MVVRFFRRTTARRASVLSTSISCVSDDRASTGTPASSATSTEMSWPARIPSGTTGGEMRAASESAPALVAASAAALVEASAGRFAAAPSVAFSVAGGAARLAGM